MNNDIDTFYKVYRLNGDLIFEPVEESPEPDEEPVLVFQEYWGFGKGSLLDSRFSVEDI